MVDVLKWLSLALSVVSIVLAMSLLIASTATSYKRHTIVRVRSIPHEADP